MDDHIRSFPVRISHYSSRAVKYLSSTLTVTKMHKMFLEQYYPDCAAEINNGTNNDKISGRPTCKYFVYRKYYNDNFGYSFGKPKSDVCK